MRIFYGCERLFLKAREKPARIKRTSVCCLLFILFGLSTSVLADDVEIYTAGGEGVKPNVLIIFDNSESMKDTIPSAIYDSGVSYPGGYPADTVYYRWRGSWDHEFRDSVANITCPEARTALETEGFYNGKISYDTTCGGTATRNLRTGNYLNFLGTNPPAQHPKLGVAKGTIQSFVNTTYGIRFGAMIFNPDQGGHLLREVRDMTPQNRSDLHSAIGGISADTETPLAETLFETGLYFTGAPSYFNRGVNYTSPITHWCQNNYVIVISDGLSTKDRDPILKTIGNDGDTDVDEADPGAYENEGSDYLDDVAKYLYNLDLRPDLDEKQNIRTYTIGFTIDNQLLEDTAENGRGNYYYVHNAQSFSIVFQTLIQEILEESTSFTAPVVPISQMEKTTSANRIYLAQFKPAEDAFWKGNIKKFALATEEVGDITVGEILDANGDKATEEMGHIVNTAVSFWGSFDPDGGETEAGGVGEVLLNREAPRKIYTWLDVNERPLSHPNNAFVDGNPKLTNALLQAADDIERGQIIDFVHGYDAYDDDMDFDATEKRRWILGAFLHSRPVVVTYNESTSVIFAGANDGMLHAFLDTDGTELWAFIPPDLLGRLKRLHGGVLEYFVDGAPKAAVMDQDGDGVIESAEGDQVILVFGQRRGGSHYYALDVTDPNGPKYLWDISPDQVDFSEIGQSWSTPVIGNLRIGQDGRMVVFLGGGYDTNQDDDPVVGLDTAGRGIYVVELLDGGLVWKSTFDPVSNPSMSYCISSDVAAIDTEASGYIDRLYVGDTGGQMWRCEIGDPDPANWTARRIFDDSGNGRKIFYPPDVVLEHGYEMLFWGTGDRANPRNESIVNRIYGLKDRNPDSPFTEDDLVNVTANLIQDGTEQERADTLNALNSHDGWYINLAENPGEKVLAPSITYFGAAYLSTFTPTAGDPFDLCYVGEGTARLYALDYKTAAAVLNFDTSSDDLDKGDRSKVIGAAIPSGMVIAIIRGESTSFIGVGGGISTSDIVHPKAITRIYWRQSI